MSDYRMKALVHGDAGAGKSWLGASTPGPRLVLDAEGGAPFARQLTADGSILPPSRKWDPLHETVPTDLDPNESVFVRVRTPEDIERVYAWLASGQHEFNSVILDSITDIQLSMRYEIRDGQEKQRDVTDMRSWGILLDRMMEVCRKFRDLTDHPTRPLWCVLVIAGSEQGQNSGKWGPQVQGGLARRLAGYFDVVMFLENEIDVITRTSIRKGHIVSTPFWQAKDRTHVLSAAYGEAIPNPDMRAMMQVLNSQEAQQ